MFFGVLQDCFGGFYDAVCVSYDLQWETFLVEVAGLDVPEVEVYGWDACEGGFSACCASAAHHQVDVGE